MDILCVWRCEHITITADHPEYLNIKKHNNQIELKKKYDGIDTEKDTRNTYTHLHIDQERN